jgi:hypothetical protein
MKQFLFYFFVLFTVALKAQNIVPNPSFEDTVSSPLGGAIDDASGWINCNLSPDYYNAGFNSYSPSFGVPNCSFTGYQNAFMGNAFSGLALTQVPDQPGEFIGVQLTQTLTIGTKYYVSGYVSRADNFLCSSNNFGFRFFNSLYFLPSFSPPPIDNFAHVNSSVVITDSAGWSFISGSFIADSTYQYMVMGNFFNLSLTDTLNCFFNPDVSYYYIDNICVSSDSATCMVPTSVQQFSLQKTEISIFPNPCSNFIQIKNSTSDVGYSLVNELGQICMNGRLKPNDKIDVSSLPSGLYFFRTDLYSLKVIINHN